MVLPSGVVVGDVDVGLELHVGQGVGKHLFDTFHHQAAVAVGKGDAVAHLVPVAVEFRCLQRQERQLYARLHFAEIHLVENLRTFVVVVAHLFAEVARAGVDHYPQPSFTVFLQFNEMVAASQRSHLT